MDARIVDLRARFRRLHEAGCFVIPNPWDVGSARALVALGFPAVATTSAGFAWSVGQSDNAISLDDALVHFRQMVNGVDVPVNADFEGAFAVDPEGVATNVARAVETGLAGVSVEDNNHDPQKPLLDLSLAVERIAAARAAIDRASPGAVLVARSEGFVAGQPDLAETIRRLTAFAEAGADCLYAPGIRDLAAISTVVRAVAPKPVNVLVSTPFATVEQLAELGVRRISVGGALARVAWGSFLAAARQIASNGTFEGLSTGFPGTELNAMFARPAPRSDSH